MGTSRGAEFIDNLFHFRIVNNEGTGEVYKLEAGTVEGCLRLYIEFQCPYYALPLSGAGYLVNVAARAGGGRFNPDLGKLPRQYPT